EGARRAVGSAAGPLDDRVEVHGRPRDLRRGGDEPALQLPRATTLADHQVPQDSLLPALVVGGQARRPGPVAKLVAPGVVVLRGEHAVLGVDDLVPAAAGVKAEDDLGTALTEGGLELVAIAPRLDRRLDRLELEALEPTEPGERVAHLLLLVAQLLGIGQALPGSSRAGRAAVVAAVRHPVGRLPQDLHRRRLGVTALRSGYLSLNPVAGAGAADEDDVAVASRNALAAVGEGVDVQGEGLSTARARVLSPGRRPPRGRRVRRPHATRGSVG